MPNHANPDEWATGEVVTFVVDSQDVGIRLDKFLAQCIALSFIRFSRSAPENPIVLEAQYFKSTSFDRGLFNFFLLHGKNDGLKNEIIEKYFIRNFKGELNKYEEAEFLGNNDNIIEDFLNKSLSASDSGCVNIPIGLLS